MNAGYTYRERLGPQVAGRSVLEHLARAHPHGDRRVWRARIEAGEVEVDGRRPSADDPLRPGQTLLWHRPPWEEPPAPRTFGIVYEDAHLLVVDKPAGLPTLPGAGYLENTLLHRVRAHFGRVDPLHRLGRGTSGLTLFARTDLARRRLSAALRERRGFEKIYLALVEGRPSTARFEVRTPIGPRPDPICGRLHAVSPDGKAARSEIQVLAGDGAVSLCAVRIETGRPHQIRIHLAWAGHPLLGDPLYGPGGVRRAGSEARPGDVGYHLHAYRLAFVHPESGRWVRLCAPPPDLVAWPALVSEAALSVVSFEDSRSEDVP